MSVRVSVADHDQANALAPPNWGQIIFQSANEMANNQLAKQRMAEIQGDVAAEQDAYDKRKKAIRAEFLKEHDVRDDDEAQSQKGDSSDDAVMVEGGGPAGNQGSAKKKQKKKKGSK